MRLGFWQLDRAGEKRAIEQQQQVMMKKGQLEYKQSCFTR